MKYLAHSCFVIILTLFGCDRVFENEIENTIAPELHVFVIGSASHSDRVTGASVSLYQVTENGPGNEVLATKQTDAEGKAVFTESELLEPGRFFIRATEGSRQGENETKYLLLNDGHTYHYIQIQ